MASVGTVWANIKLNIKDFSANMTRASIMLGRFAANATYAATGTSEAFRSYGKEIDQANRELHKHKIGLKDVTRIVSGILISQTFYSTAFAIRNANEALWEFNESLDYAKVTYSSLFGSAELGTGFLNILKDYAEETIFSFEDLANITKKLLAYGIPYENLMYITESLTNLGAMSGDSAALDRIALALGQIYTKGKLSAEEMRQLANAYVPIYDIVKEQFGLTGEQMGKIGELNLPASEVINAVVDYANEEFSGVADAAMLTITGLKQKIVDSLKNIGIDMIAPVSAFYKSLLVYISKELANISKIFEAGGMGGLFEYLVPDESSQRLLRQFLATIHNLLSALAKSIVVIAQLFSSVLAPAFMHTFNIIGPVVTGAINILNGFVSVALDNVAVVRVLSGVLAAAAFMWTVFKLKALGALVIGALAKVIYGVAGAVLFLARALTAHPIVMLILLIGTGLAAGLAAVAASAGNAGNAITNLFDKLSKYGNGVGSSDILQPTEGIEDTIGNIEDYSNKLSGVTDALDDAGEAAGEAGKNAGKGAKAAAKGLLSFDEVYKLNEPTDSSGASGTEGLGDISGFLDELGALGGGISDAFMPDIPDLSSFFTGFKDKFSSGFLDMWKELSDNIATMGIGTIIGAVLGALLGGKLGSKIGAIAGTIAGWFWADLADALNLTDVGKIAIPITTGLGAAIGKLGGPLGMGVGAAIGLLVGWLIEAITRGITEGDWSGIGLPISSGIGMAIGGIVGGPAGALIGGAIGTLASTLMKWIADAFNFTDAGKIALPIATTLGAGIGMIAGGPLGAVVGAAIGAFVGWLGEAISKGITEGDWSSLLGTAIGFVFGQIPGGIIGGWLLDNFSDDLSEVWNKISSWFTELKDNIVDWASDTFGPILSWLDDTVKGFATWVSDTYTDISTWITNTKTGYSTWEADTWNSLSTWWNDTKEGFSTWYTDTFSSVSGWWNETKEGFGTWWSDTWESLSTWWSDTVDEFSNWDAITGDTLGNWWEDTTSGFTTWVSDTWDSLSKWFDDTFGGFTTWVSDTYDALSSWFGDTLLGFATWSLDTWNSLDTWVDDTWESIDAWVTDTWNRFNQWKDDIIKIISDWVVDAFKLVSQWVADTWNTFTKWVSDVYNKFIEWKDKVIEAISNFVIETYEAIAQWVTDTWNKFAQWVTDVYNKFNEWKESVVKVIGGFAIAAYKAIEKWATDTWNKFYTWFTDTKKDIKKWWESLWDAKTWTSAWKHLEKWFSNFWDDIFGWFGDIKKSVSKWWDGLWNLNTPSLSGPTVTTSSSGVKIGHATGGIFNREHIARFAEGNKAEMVVPLENNSAMQPFVNAISNGIIEGIAPSLLSASGRTSNNLPPLYVGTLIADERGLKELYKKFEVYEAKELARKGLA